MTPAFLAAVLEALLPGDAAGVPGGREAGIDLAAHAEAAAMLQLIAVTAGSEEAFLAAPPAVQHAALAAAETNSPEQFRRFLQPILADYCETPAVLAAFGGLAEPPQPEGRALEEMDAEILAALDRVRIRGRIWRDPQSS
jgi:hypothetical protein